jgi:hypothetical protein
MGEKIDIIRLKRSDLYSPTYRQLIESLFGKEQAEKRLRYAQWLFADNPSLKKDEDLPIYLCRIDNKYVAQIAVIPVQMILAGNSIRAGWSVDLQVKSDYQRRGIGIKLENATYQDFPVIMSLGQSEAGFNIASKLGWHYSDNRLTYYKCFLGSHLILKYLAIKIGLLKRSEPKALPQKIFRGPKEVSFKSIDSFKEIKTSLNHQDIKDGKAVLILRTPAFLEWRYACNPFIKYFIHRLRTFDSFDIYIVWKIVNDNYWRRARVIDILYSNDVPAVAMKAALKALRECASFYGADIIECETSDALVLECLPKTLLSKKYPGKRFLWWTRNMEEIKFTPIDHFKLYAGDCDVETIDYLD